MKLSLNWLREYVDFEADAQTLAERLTFAGIEVEGLEARGAVPGRIIVGEITEVEPHMHANHLHICLVNTGSEILRVVTGADNCAVGARVPLAMPGATLPNGTAVKAQKISGEMSQGILCAEDELGLSEDHSGLMILPPDAKVGRPLAEVLGPPDQVLTLEITPNRPDLLGLIGLAREVAVLFGSKLKWPAGELAEAGAPLQGSFAVEVENHRDCPRYIARLLRGATVGPSPFWLRHRLALAGYKSINNIVDVTNYVMHECGQPLHAFDFSLLEGGRIIVRRAKDGEKIKALDGIEYALKPAMLAIADARKPVAIAGVMGGEESSIHPGTGAVLLESACFHPPLIRQTSKTLALSSESSYRFERGVDINLSDFASRRAGALMAAVAGAKPAPGAIDVFPEAPPEKHIACRYRRVSGLLGIAVPPERVRSIFNALDLPAREDGAERCLVAVGSLRRDIESEADLVEEVARIHGLENIPCRDPRCHVVAAADDRPVRAQLQCRHILASLGLQEIMNYSFVSEKALDLFDASGAGNRIRIPRPVSADQTCLRDSLLPQMMETLGRNRARQVGEAAFYELARVYAATKTEPFHEETRVAVGLMGAVNRAPLKKRRIINETEIFSWLKGILAGFYARLTRADALSGTGRENEAGLVLTEASPQGFYAACFKPRRYAQVTLRGQPCGIMGLLRDDLRREWRIGEPVGLMEFALGPFLQGAFKTPQSSALPNFPSIMRDIALKAPFSVRHADITKTIWKNAPKELTSVALFDIYEGKEIGAGFKSMAYSLTYQSTERTLTDEETNRFHDAVKKQLKKELVVEIREG